MGEPLWLLPLRRRRWTAPWIRQLPRHAHPPASREPSAADLDHRHHRRRDAGVGLLDSPAALGALAGVRQSERRAGGMSTAHGYVDLFGATYALQPAPSRQRKPRPAWRGLYADVPGTGPTGEKCRTCRHALRIQPSARAFYKCGMARKLWTGGEATDVRLAAPACSRWERRA